MSQVEIYLGLIHNLLLLRDKLHCIVEKKLNNNPEVIKSTRCRGLLMDLWDTGLAIWWRRDFFFQRPLEVLQSKNAMLP